MADKQRTCSIADCNKRHFGRGWCETHYLRWRRNGDPLKCRPRRQEGEAIRWLHAVAIPFNGYECLPWPFLRCPKGYGRVSYQGRMAVVSRFICERTHGCPTSARLHAAHDCGNSSCVNPHHIRWATAQENEADKIMHGTSQHTRTSFAKLTSKQVIHIRDKFATGRCLQKHLAQEFNVSVSTISEIVNRRTWTQI